MPDVASDLPPTAERLLRIGAAWSQGRRPKPVDLTWLAVELARMMAPDSANLIAELLSGDNDGAEPPASRHPGGRPIIDDRAALTEIGFLLDNSRAPSVAAACSLVASTLSARSTQSHEATTHRLRRKYRQVMSRQN